MPCSCPVPRRANSTGVPATGPRGSPEPCPVDAPISLAYLSPIPPPHQSLCSISPRALQTLCPSLHPLSASCREEPAAPPAPPKPAGERGARSRDPGTPPSAQRPGCPGTPSSQAKWPASRLLPGQGPLGLVCLSSSPGQPRSLLPAAATAVCFLRCVSFFLLS